METPNLTAQIRARMRTFRTTAGYSQSQMANLLAMDERNYKRVESGEKKILDTDLVERFCDILQLPVHALLLGSESAERVNHILSLQWTALRKLVESIQSMEQVLHDSVMTPTPPRQGKSSGPEAVT